MVNNDYDDRSIDPSEKIGEDFFFDLDRSIEEYEEIDIGLLMETLDGIGAIEQESVQINEEEINLSNKFVKVISNILRYEFSEEDALHNNRFICLKCTSNSCNHISSKLNKSNLDIMLNNMERNCDHPEVSRQIIDDFCVQCVVDMCKSIELEEENSIVKVWDTLDFSEYLYWMDKMKLPLVWFN